MNLVPFKTGGRGAHRVTTYEDSETGLLHRRCNICKEVFPLDIYPVAAIDKNWGRAYRCRECHRKRTNELALHLPLRYGITKEQYNRMFSDQKGRCAICGGASNKRLAVDHNHATGQVRGLLCFKCNSMLGNAGDDPSTLEAAANYLRAN